MSKEKKSKISYFQSNFTSTVSVALVLLLVGVVAFLGILADSFADRLKENVGFNVVMRGDATADDIIEMDKMWKSQPYVARVKYISKEEALESWQKDTGENLVELFGINPLSAEYEIYVKSNYAVTDSLTKIGKTLSAIPFVEEVAMHQAEVDTANRNIGNIAVVLLAVAALLIFISFALINNTVRLTVYSRRFLIHTMKLVGAKPGFIRRPFIISNMLNGLIAALVAIALLIAAYFPLSNLDYSINEYFDWTSIIIVFAGLIATGILICGIAAFFAADKYIRLNYDDLFKR